MPDRWSTQQLAEFIAAVSATQDADEACRIGVERAAEALDAEVCALVRGGAVVASLGWPRMEIPEVELGRAVDGACDAVPLPGAGRVAAEVARLDDGSAGALVLARTGDALERSEVGLLRAMARTLALALRSIGTIADERALRLRSEEQARENAKLAARLQERQRMMEGLALIQRSISHRRPLQDVLHAVTVQAADLLDADTPALFLRDVERPGTLRAVTDLESDRAVARATAERDLGDGVAGRAFAEGRLILVEDYASAPGALPQYVEAGLRSAMAAPVHEEGEVVGALVVGTYDPQRRFSRADQETLTTLAEHVSLALTDNKTVGAMVHQALHDALTGLPNRALFLDRLGQALKRARRGGRVAVLFCDLDRFKTVNDSLGHAAGDELLCAVAERLGEGLRAADTAARLGGDEFAVLVEDLGDDAEALAVAERIGVALREPFDVQGREMFVSASIGIAIGDESGDELLRNADVAMYAAKAEGKGRHRVFEPAMRAEVVERLELEADLQRAVERGELRVHFQPLVQLADGTLTGFEALVRWQHPRRGLVPPLSFIPLAEESDLIADVGSFVLQEACRQVQEWRLATGRPYTVAVNLSGRQLERPGLADELAATIASTGMDPQSVVLEITETVLMQDTESTIARLAALREHGMRLAVDDFGTGYSSLRYLRRFPIDLLKMAKPFVDGVAETGEGAALARTIVDLGESLGLQIVAEGIEHHAQLAQLRRLGCHLGQGYLFARPLEAVELRAALDARRSWVPERAVA